MFVRLSGTKFIRVLNPHLSSSESNQRPFKKHSEVRGQAEGNQRAISRNLKYFVRFNNNNTFKLFLFANMLCGQCYLLLWTAPIRPAPVRVCDACVGASHFHLQPHHHSCPLKVWISKFVKARKEHLRKLTLLFMYTICSTYYVQNCQSSIVIKEQKEHSTCDII